MVLNIMQCLQASRGSAVPKMGYPFRWLTDLSSIWRTDSTDLGTRSGGHVPVVLLFEHLIVLSLSHLLTNIIVMSTWLQIMRTRGALFIHVVNVISSWLFKVLQFLIGERGTGLSLKLLFVFFIETKGWFFTCFCDDVWSCAKLQPYGRR